MSAAIDQFSCSWWPCLPLLAFSPKRTAPWLCSAYSSASLTTMSDLSASEQSLSRLSKLGRPIAPRPALMAKALRVLSQPSHSSFDPETSKWRVIEVIDRPHSRVFKVEVGPGDGSGAICLTYYKSADIPVDSSGQIELKRYHQLSTSMGRSSTCAARFASFGKPLGVDTAPILAVDDHRLETVSLGVPGILMKDLIRKARWDHRDLPTVFVKIGIACRVIDDNFQFTMTPEARGEVLRTYTRSIKRTRSRHGDEVNLLMSSLSEMLDVATSSNRPAVLTHGGLSFSNALIDDHLYLIDFDWRPQLLHYDLAVVHHRTQFNRNLPARLIPQLLGALLEGYGKADVTATPEWRLAKTYKLLQTLARGERRYSRPRFRRRILSEIRPLVEE